MTFNAWTHSQFCGFHFSLLYFSADEKETWLVSGNITLLWWTIEMQLGPDVDWGVE